MSAFWKESFMSFDDIKPDENYKLQPLELETNVADHYDRNAGVENDHFSQPGIFFREVLSDYDKTNLVRNVVGSMKGITGPKKFEIINRQLCHFFRADIGLGMAIASGLEVNVEESQSLFSHNSTSLQQLT